jgi:hypothetical protein
VFILILFPTLASADGGAIRLSAQHDIYRVTVFTSPTVLRAGPVDISVLVQEAATGELASDVQVTIEAVRRGTIQAAFHGPATTEAATNKLYHAAILDLPEPGWYSVDVAIDGALGKAQVQFEMEVAEPLPTWLPMLPWIGWPVVAIALFSVHQVLVRRRSVELAK